MKSYDVTIQMRPRQQCFHMVIFTFKFFTKLKLGFLLNFNSRHSWERKGYWINVLLLRRPGAGKGNPKKPYREVGVNPPIPLYD